MLVAWRDGAARGREPCSPRTHGWEKEKNAGAADAKAFRSHSSGFTAAWPPLLLVGKRQANAECKMLPVQLKAELHSTAPRAGKLPGAAGGRIWGCYPSEEETKVVFV